MAATSVVSRENIELWGATSQKLYLFRRAIEEMQKVSDAGLMDERGYQWVAGVHGGFGGAPYCQHGNLNFVTWHRPYILEYELKLRDQIKKIAGPYEADEWRLPYWKWDAADVAGIPKAFTVKTYDDNGTTKPNPLFSQPYQLPYNPGPPVPPGSTPTYRNPGPLRTLRALRQLVLDAMAEKTFNLFSGALERPHNSIHVWVRGFMVTFRSSFDPLFWVHHCNIDRQWWDWQQANGDASVPRSVRDFQCQPFKFEDISAAAFFDTREHGYTYAVSRNMMTRTDVLEQATADGANAPVTEALVVDLPELSHDSDRVRIHLHGLEHTTETYDLRFFANRKTPPTASTPTTPRSGFVGSYAILGHGSCPGAPGHCEVTNAPLNADQRQKHHLSPFDISIDVSAGLKRLALARKKKKKSAVGAGKISLSVLVVNAEGKQVPHDVIRFDNISITTH